MGAQKDNLRLLDIITGVFVTSLVIVPSASSKFIAVGQFNLPGATLIFPLAFIFNDLFTEVYGYSKSRRIIWTGMACQLLASFYYWLIGIWPAAPFWTNQLRTTRSSVPPLELPSLALPPSRAKHPNLESCLGKPRLLYPN